MLRNKHAKVIIPLALGLWALGLWLAWGVVIAADLPRATKVALEVALAVGMAVGIPTVVFYLMSDQGWSALAKRYRARGTFRGEWQRLPTVLMAMVPVEHPDFQRTKLMVHGAVRVGTSPEALHLSMLFSKVPVLGSRFFPHVAIPWSAVVSTRPYEAQGWFKKNEPGNLLQANLDPNYTGTFVELEVGDPPVFIQLPESVVGEVLPRQPGTTSRAWRAALSPGARRR